MAFIIKIFNILSLLILFIRFSNSTWFKSYSLVRKIEVLKRKEVESILHTKINYDNILYIISDNWYYFYNKRKLLLCLSYKSHEDIDRIFVEANSEPMKIATGNICGK